MASCKGGPSGDSSREGRGTPHTAHRAHRVDRTEPQASEACPLCHSQQVAGNALPHTKVQPLLRNIQNPKSQQDPKPPSPQEVPLTWLPGQSGAPPAISGLKMALSQSNQTLTSHAWGPLLSGTSRPKRG